MEQDTAGPGVSPGWTYDPHHGEIRRDGYFIARIQSQTAYICLDEEDDADRLRRHEWDLHGRRMAASEELVLLVLDMRDAIVNQSLLDDRFGDVGLGRTKLIERANSLLFKIQNPESPS